MTKEYGIVRVSKGKLVEDGMFIPDSRLGELTGYSVRYLITHGIHKNAVRFERRYDDLIIWDGMHIDDIIKQCTMRTFMQIKDILSDIPARLDCNMKVMFKKED